MKERGVSKRTAGKSFVIAAIISIGLGHTGLLAASQAGDDGKAAPYEFVWLKHIRATKARQYLAKLELATASQLPGSEALLITGQPDEVARAKTVLALVDIEETVVVQEIMPASQARQMPSRQKMAELLGDIAIGDFAEPPGGTSADRALVDIHHNTVIVIAPAGQVQRVITAVKEPDKLKKPESVPPTPEAETPAAPQPLQTPEQEKPGSGAPKDLQSQELPTPVVLEAEPEEKPAEKGEPEPETAPKAKSKPDVQDDTEADGKSEEHETSKPPKLPKPPVAPDLLKKQEAAKAIMQALKDRKTQPTTAEQKQPETKQPDKAEQPGINVYNVEDIPNGSETLRLDLPDKCDIVLLLNLVGETLGLDFLYDDQKVQGQVTLKLQGKYSGPIKVKELYPLLESVLRFKGFVMTRKNNLVTVVPKEEALEIDPVLYTGKEKAKGVKPGDVVIARVFELEHVDTSSAQNLLEGMKLGVSVSPIPEAKTLIVTGFAYRMPRVEELLEMIDKPGEPKKFRFRQLQYTMAQTLAEKIKTLAEQLGTISVSVPEMADDEYKPSPKRQGETDAQYRLRTARERAAAAAKRRAQQTQAQTRGAPEQPSEPTVYLDADERTNRILMIGLQKQLEDVDDLIDALDVEQQDLRTLELYRIQHVGAEDVKTKLQEIGIISASQTTTRSERITTTGKSSTPPPRSPVRTTTEEKGPLVEEPQVVVIEPTNSLLVNGTAEQHARIASIIEYVDSQADLPSIPYVVYPLENQDPNQLQAVLEKLIMETTEKEDKEGKTITKEPRRKEERPPVIVADPKTYSLIVYANKQDQQWIESLIKQLDEYRPQVLLDVTLVAIEKTDEFSYDLNLISSFPDLTETSGLTDVITSLSDAARDRFIDLQAAAADEIGTAFYGDRHINILLEAMQKKKYGRILARPKLLVNDNEQGTINTTRTTFVTRKETSFIPGTEEGSSIPTEKDIFESYDEGVTLDIEPHISKGDQLRLTITMNRTDFEGLDPASPKPPDTVTSEVTTVVTVPNSTTIILGGLERLRQNKAGNKVPILGDIPLIGGLFRNASNTDTQRRLYVFVKAHILRPGQELTGTSDIEVVSQTNREKFEKYEAEMQQYEDWPGIKPEPMEPVKVLEVD
jgi:type II secretory pathway component GspD/PulD (secretin)